MFSKNVRTVLLGAVLGVFVIGTAWAEDPVAKAPAAKPVAKPVAKAKPVTNEVAVLETSKGRMVVDFWEKDAPQTVANFKKLARQGYYDGTGFHRIIKGFMIQGGDPKSKNPTAPDLGTGGPGYTIKDEFNAHPHVKGVLSMANTGTPNSAGSQFFVMHGTNAGLDGHYTAFGHVIAGMDVLDKIANSATGPNPSMPGENSKPVDWTTLKSVKVMSKAAYAASAHAVKKAGAGKPAEVKSGMGAGAGMDVGAGQSKSAGVSSSTESSGHPGHDTVEKAKEATQPATSTPSGENGAESGK